MSPIVITGNDIAYGQPVSGLIDAGPVVPRHPPSTLEQMTKYLSVSNALPGPIMLSHQPGLPVRADAGGMGVAGKGVEHQDGVGLARVQLAVGLVSDFHRRERGAVIQGQGIEPYAACFNDHFRGETP